MRMEFEKIDITDLIIIISLAVGLIIAILTDQKELSMSIVSGMFGYVGGSYMKPSSNKNNNIPVGTTQTTTTNSVSTIESKMTDKLNLSKMKNN